MRNLIFEFEQEKTLEFGLKLNELQVDTLKKIGISKSILASANAGYCIRIENAEKICNALGLKYDDYFTTEVQSHAYGRTLATILADAKRQRLVEHSFASRDYIAPIQGYKKEVKY